jgi:23S rRNA pseudoU1915 N3-methylase RlmH
MKPDQVATKMADFAGRTAAMRSLGTRGVNVEYAANTANKAIDLAEEAYNKLPRTAFVPFNKLIDLAAKNLSSPEQAAAYAATNTLVNEYARVAAGGSNQATEGMRQHAREMLNTAMDHKSFNAVLGMMRREIQTAKSAYQETRQEFLSDHSEAKPGGPTAPVTPGVGAPVAAAAAAATSSAPTTVRQNGHTYQRQPDGSYKAID